MSEYVMNKETGKIELHFEKADYMALSEDLKSEIKSNFLFSRKSGAWVSRCKFPNLYRAEAVAKKLGLADGGKVGETLSFEEQMQRKAEKAERRAERYDSKAERATEHGMALQKPINDMHGDISFFTQPHINSSAGRAFSRKRERMWAAWERGYEEFKKSEYFKERAEIARATADQTKPTDKGFIDRRIKDAEKTIRAQKKNLEHYNELLEKIEAGEEIKNYRNELITAETINEWIEKAEMIVEDAISKSIYYHECLEAAGGVMFSQDNIKVGYIVNIRRWGNCKVTGTGKVNISYEILTGGAAGLGGKAAYAEIESIVTTDIQISKHPFVTGDTFTVKEWNGKEYAPKEYVVTKITDEKVTIKADGGRAKTLKPRKFGRPGEESWALGITNGLNGTVYKKAE